MGQRQHLAVVDRGAEYLGTDTSGVVDLVVYLYGQSLWHPVYGEKREECGKKSPQMCKT